MKENWRWMSLVFVSSFIIYYSTCGPTIFWEDSAALTISSYVLGIPHSPGFPVYNLWGRVFTLMPGQNVAFKVNLMSAFWGSLALVIIWCLLVEILKQVQVTQRKQKSEFTIKILSLGTVLFFGLTQSFWNQTTRAEVYSLSIFFCVLLIYMLFMWWEKKLNFRFLLLLSFLFGLSLTSHPLIILTLVPGASLFVILLKYKQKVSLAKLGFLLVFFFLALSLYLYLPVRASANPVFNWGEPYSWQNLITYLTKSEDWKNAVTAYNYPFLVNLRFMLAFPVEEFSLWLFAFAITGAFICFKRLNKFFYFTAGIFLVNIWMSAWAADFSFRNYDLLGYLLPALLVFTIWFGMGLYAFFIRISQFLQQKIFHTGRRKISAIQPLCALVISLILVLLNFKHNISACNHRDNSFAFFYSLEILQKAAPQALLLVSDDNSLLTLKYQQLVSKRRPDVKVISPQTLTKRSYYSQVVKSYPEILLPAYQLENVNWASEIILLNSSKSPIYYQYGKNLDSLNYHLKPKDYFLEYTSERIDWEKEDMQTHFDWIKATLGQIRSSQPDIITREHFGNLLFNWGVFYDRVNRPDCSSRFFLMGLSTDPTSPRTYTQLGKGFLKSGHREQALKFFQAALELDPYNPEARRILKELRERES